MRQITERGGTAAASQPATTLLVRPDSLDPLVSIRAIRFAGPDTLYARQLKRGFDLLLGSLLLLLFAPLIVIAAIAVIVTSGAPAFYPSERAGRGGKPFRMWKLRSMCRDADQVLESWLSDPAFAADFHAHYKVKDDPRITRVGRLLRRSSIDELPQLLNVVRGEMSLVGPRPLSHAELDHFGARASELLSVRPGITGQWQVTQRNRASYPDRVLLELSSVRDSSFLNDMSVLLRTLIIPLRFDGR